jgi:hypothetical protein
MAKIHHKKIYLKNITIITTGNHGVHVLGSNESLATHNKFY